jgi:hypothetical protein
VHGERGQGERPALLGGRHDARDRGVVVDHVDQDAQDALLAPVDHDDGTHLSTFAS